MKHVDQLSAAATARPAAPDFYSQDVAPRLVLPEERWRTRPLRVDGAVIARDITLSRWEAGSSQQGLDVCSTGPEPRHVISLALKPASMVFNWGKICLTGAYPAGTLMITGPRDHECRASYQSPMDVFRVYVPPQLLVEGMDGLVPGRLKVAPELCGAELVHDETLSRLVASLVDVDEQGGLLAPLIAEGVGIALAVRLLSLYSGVVPSEEAPPKRSLAPWRLERVKEYIEAHLNQAVSLDALSKIAGLSRIRFGAQFREATGMTPYAYVLQRRIAFTQQLLRENQSSLADIALRAGFSSQAHFTTVFSRQLGMSPGQWRRSILK